MEYFCYGFLNFCSKISEPGVTKSAAFAALAADGEEHEEGEAWGVDGDLLLDEEGNPEGDDLELVGAGGDEEGWDVGFITSI